MRKYYLFVVLIVLISNVVGVSSYMVSPEIPSSLALINISLILVNTILFLYVASITLDDYLQVKDLIVSRGISSYRVNRIVLVAMIKVIGKLWTLKYVLELLLGASDICISINFLLTIVLLIVLMFYLSQVYTLSNILSLFIVVLVIDSSQNFELLIGNIDPMMVAFKSAVIVSLSVVNLRGVINDDKAKKL